MTANDYQFQKLCESIFALSSGIRFVGVIDRMGRLIAGGMRKGVTSMGNFWISVCCYCSGGLLVIASFSCLGLVFFILEPF